MAARPRILIAGPAAEAAGLQDRLPALGYAVCAAVHSGRQAVAEAARLRPALALIDAGLSGEVSGIDAAGQIGSRFDVPVVLLIGQGSEGLLPAARASEPFGCVWLPCADRQLQSILDTALSLHGREAALQERAERLERDVAELRADARMLGVFINVSGRPMQDGPADLRGGVIVFHDVTERVHAEQALMQAFAQGRMEVVDTILHNIGNAINSVSIGVGTVRDELRKNALSRRLSALGQALEAHRGDLLSYLTEDPQGRKVAPFVLALAADAAARNERLTRTVERVKSRVDHIVDIISTQKSFHEGTTARKIVNLRQSIGDALKVLAESLESRGIALRVDCERAPAEIRIEESRLHQMLVNLVKNGMEAIAELAPEAAPEAPRIAIECYLQQEFLVIDVVDNGIGIKDDRHRLIFTAGYTSKKDGNGLGLHSAANFVIASGGKIYPLSGGIGKGTTMRVMLRRSSTLPEDAPERTENGSTKAVGVSGLEAPAGRP